MSSGERSGITRGMYGSQMDMEQYESRIRAVENEKKIEEEQRQLLVLRDHIEGAEYGPSGRAGIKGAHNKNSFLKAVDDTGAKIISSTPNTQIPGVEKIFYKMPKKNAQGRPTGDYQAGMKMKTVYDPSIISTDEYIRRGIEAANDSTGRNSANAHAREWTGTDNEGVKWHGYCDRRGNITSFYPED